MGQMITPEKLTVECCLRNKKYYIDFYQREYVWKKETVEMLLNDICWSFENSYASLKDMDLSTDVMARYSWYYLNVFITNSINGKVYIVDGQQRLTTLTLIAIYLYHNIHDERIKNVLRECIFSTDLDAGNIYVIDHEKRKKIMTGLFQSNNVVPPESFANPTEKNLFERYRNIYAFFAQKEFDERKLHAFGRYFLQRLVLVELSIDKDDTPMVFEVINDRGEALKKFEILKGKLIGALPKENSEEYSDIWNDAMYKIDGFEDEFFANYLKAKFIFVNDSAKIVSITNAFHRYIFETDNDIARTLGFRRQDPDHIDKIKDFLKNDLPYYAGLYAKIRNNSDNCEFLEYDNGINEMSGQYMNILAACRLHDPQEKEKIRQIAFETDRLCMLLRLNGIYNSNDLQDILYALNARLKETELDHYRDVFNEFLRKEFQNKTKRKLSDALLDYEIFSKRDYTNMERRSVRYFFARVEKFLNDGKQEQMAHSVYDMSTRTSNLLGFHIEHILAENEENRSSFQTEEEFEDYRNRLGGLLILRGKENTSSGNEPYAEKLKTYANSSMIWAQSLAEDFYHHTNQYWEMFRRDFCAKHGIELKSVSVFDKTALVERTRLLYEIAREIWEC